MYSFVCTFVYIRGTCTCTCRKIRKNIEKKNEEPWGNSQEDMWLVDNNFEKKRKGNKIENKDRNANFIKSVFSLLDKTSSLMISFLSSPWFLASYNVLLVLLDFVSFFNLVDGVTISRVYLNIFLKIDIFSLFRTRWEKKTVRWRSCSLAF